MFPEYLITKAEQLLTYCKVNHLKISTAESCTGGLLSGLLTSISGSSEAFDMGFVTYSNASKTQLLGVDPKSISKHGAVSKETVTEMAEGALRKANADIALAISGVAGPGGYTKENPVGLVYIACATRFDTRYEKHHFDGDRQSIRLQSVEKAIEVALLRGA